jgi:acetylornithine deacetylase/succinyl-diaminopimelate desuccinylase-like protein
MAAVLYGPGDVALAHAVNESITVAEIGEAVAVLVAAIAAWSGRTDRISDTLLT